MGHRREDNIYRLRFADPDMDGLIVRARPASVGVAMDMMGLADLVDKGPSAISADQVKTVVNVFREFASALIEWNREDTEGNPVPATLEGIRSEDMQFMLKVVTAWANAGDSVPAPLGQKSNGGGQLAAVSIPTETLLPNQENSPGQS
jgi:hypothetical protein